jgi:hypothetical protein
MEYSTAVRDAQNDALETAIGTAPTLTVFSGSKPANCAAADAGTVLATGTLPSDWMAASSSGTKAKAGSWTLTGQSGAGSGTAGTYWRIKQGATCHMQGLFAAAWVGSTAYTLGQRVTNGGLVYQCATAGTSASSGGPTGTGASISDGTAVWSYVGDGAMVPDNNSIANGQTVTITSFSLTRGNA